MIGEKGFRISTGGLSVAADLYQVEQYLRYLEKNNIGNLEQLRKNRDDSRAYVMKQAVDDSFNKSDSFVNFSPLTYAICASLANAAKNDPSTAGRAAFFNISEP